MPLYTGEQLVANVAQNPIIPTQKAQKQENARKKPIDNGGISTYSGLEKDHPALNDEEQAVLAQLTRQPQEPSELIAKLDMPSGKVLSALTMLTIKGLVLKHPGGRVSLK